jgi:NADH-quinone oxidoreductase subunit N
MMMTELSLQSYAPALPEITLAVAACLILLLDVYGANRQRGLTATLTMLALVVGVLVTNQYGMVTQRTVLFDGLYVADRLAAFLKLAGFIAMGTAIFYSQEYLEQRGMHGGEYYVLCLTALLGIFVLISANSLLTVYLGVELLSLSLYAMVAFDRESGIAAEAAIKYFVLGAIASGILVYGMSMLYGLTGTLNLDVLGRVVGQTHSYGLVIGVAFVVAAIAFKFGAVPFSMWVPDVYDGAPTCVTLYIATVSTLGSFALIQRLLAHGLATLPASWMLMIEAMAVASLLVGNVVAIAQTNIKRMLAYSAIANAGFILLGFATGQVAGYQAALFFTIAYVLTTLAVFGVMVLMFSTAGVPPFVGFWAKLWIIQALLHAGAFWLAVLAMLVSVIGAFFYLRVVWYMYFEPAGDRRATPRRASFRVVLVINTAAVALLGLLPNALLELCGRLLQ